MDYIHQARAPIAEYGTYPCRGALVEDLILLFVARHAFRLASRWPEKWGALPLHEMQQAWLDIRLRGFSLWRGDLTIARHLRGDTPF
jgi:hypothetical protein